MRAIQAVTLVAAVVSLAAAEGEPPPNIVFIHADDLGWGDLGCYGQKWIATPRIDALAAEGLRFTQYYAGSTVCGPSRCCLLTGRHTGHATIRGNARDITLAETDATVAMALSKAGYATACIGKWGLGHNDQPGAANRRGFDHFFGYTDHSHAHNYYPDFLWRNREKLPLRNVIDWPPGSPPLPERPGVAREKRDYSADLIADEAIAWLKQHAKPTEKPFFLYFAPTLPHANNESKPNGMEVPDPDAYADKDWTAPNKGRAAMISRLDRDVGRVLDTLREMGVEKRTIVFFSSDNGPHREGGSDPDFFKASGPYRGIKRDLYEGGIRVPMIVRWPVRLAPGTTDAVLTHWDFLATACDLTGAPAPEKTDGISYAALLRGEKAPAKARGVLYWEFFEGAPRFAIRRGPHKAIVWSGPKENRAELYDVVADPSETHDLAAEKPEWLAELRRLAAAEHSRSDHPAWNFPAVAQ